MGCGSSAPARPAADGEPAKPRVAFDPAVAAAGTWLDPSGATPYDKLLIQLLSVDGVTNQPVVATLTGSGCGQAGTIRFDATKRGEAEGRSVWGVGGAGVMCMLAHRRDCACAEVQRSPHRIFGHLLRKCLRCSHDRPSDALVPAPRQLELEIPPAPTDMLDNLAVASGLKEGEGPVRLTLPLPSVEQGWVDIDETARAAGEDSGVRVRLRMLAQRWEDRYTTAAELAACALSEAPIQLPASAEPAERAVLAWKVRPANRSLLLWLPGRNDMFMHPHVLEPILASGLDLAVIEHRRIGRANRGADADEIRYVSHIDDLRKYAHEFDAGLAEMIRLKAAGGGEYERIVLYAHSTGGLEATVWLREGGLSSKVTHLVFNSPFFDWAMGGAQEMLLDHFDDILPLVQAVSGDALLRDKTLLKTWEGHSDYGSRLWIQYGSFDLSLRNVFSSVLTAGWAAAISEAQEQLRAGPPPSVPCLYLYTDSDAVLDGDEMYDLAKYACAPAHDLRARATPPQWHTRALLTPHGARAATDVTVHYEPCARHDMLLSYTRETNDKILGVILGWLKERGAIAY